MVVHTSDDTDTLGPIVITGLLSISGFSFQVSVQATV